jgi:hypothetical protein
MQIVVILSMRYTDFNKHSGKFTLLLSLARFDPTTNISGYEYYCQSAADFKGKDFLFAVSK